MIKERGTGLKYKKIDFNIRKNLKSSLFLEARARTGVFSGLLMIRDEPQQTDEGVL